MYPKTTFISNVTISGLENPCYYYNNVDELMNLLVNVIDDKNNYGYLILMDEIHILLNDDEAHDFSKSNFIEFLSQQRKLAINLIATTQLYNKVPKYFRDYVLQQGQVVVCKKFWLIQFNYWLDMDHTKEDDKGYIVYEKAKRQIWIHSLDEYQMYDTYATISQIKHLMKKEMENNG